MFLLSPVPFELWMAIYVAYILWVAGLCTFFLIIKLSRTSDFIEKPGTLGTLIMALSLLCVLGTYYLWPLLLILPVLLTELGAPAITAPILWGYLLLSFYLTGKLLMEPPTSRSIHM